MGKWQVALVSKESDRQFVYDVASNDPQATDAEVVLAALVEHGRMIVAGRVSEVVHEDRAGVIRIG
jgi:hypothetical protein